MRAQMRPTIPGPRPWPIVGNGLSVLRRGIFPVLQDAWRRGQPLSILFPGGTGNCAVDDDRDTYEAVFGWWVYLNFPADPVEWTGP